MIEQFYGFLSQAETCFVFDSALQQTPKTFLWKSVKNSNF